jgi:hypothetical protein
LSCVDCFIWTVLSTQVLLDRLGLLWFSCYQVIHDRLVFCWNCDFCFFTQVLLDRLGLLWFSCYQVIIDRLGLLGVC